MKTRIVLLFVAALLMQFTTVSADNYTDGITKLMDNEAISSFNTKMFEQLSQTPNVDVEYFKSQFENEAVEWIADHYRKNMPEKDFSDMVSFFLQPEELAIQKKVLSAVASSQGEEFKQKLFPQMMTLIMGGTPEDLQEPDCDPELKKEILHWMDVNFARENFKASIEAAKSVVADNALANSKLPEEQKERVTKTINGVLSFMERNTTPLLMMYMVGKVDLHDMQVLNSIEKEPFYESYKKTNLSLANDVSTLLAKVVAHMKKN